MTACPNERFWQCVSLAIIVCTICLRNTATSDSPSLRMAARGLSWLKRDIPLRDKAIRMKFFKSCDLCPRESLPDAPMFLFVMKNMHHKVGKKKLH
ncbi:hypothetical protein ANAEL_00203 [Anaerolineales bacterium]|nr:hypothetical protein ANAEL_00203 [Anaerolineales bacterium]